MLLHEAGTRPNLAREALAAAVRALPGLWYKRFGFEPALRESFSDLESHAGTCSRAAGWQAVGLSKGFAIHQPHHEQYGGLNGFTEAVAADRTFAYRLITRPL